MELFVMNRYMGEELDQTNEEEIKKNWLTKIEERKKRKLESVKNDQTVEETLDTDDASKPKIKKEVDTSELQEDDETVSPKKKKRKKLIEEEEVKEVEADDDYETINEEAEDGKGFQILGQDEFAKKQKVKRVLPDWLANPNVISTDLQNLSTTVDDIQGLDDCLVKQLKKNNITHFFPVQAQLIPYLLSNIHKFNYCWPRDVCISAPTGSGKTLAFVLPIIQDLQRRLVPKIRALVILPVQDLATQVYNEFKQYCSHTDLGVLLLQRNVSLQDEEKLMLRKSMSVNYLSLVDIIVTTPGRLVDHLKMTPGFSLKSLKYLVIDEADRVMENVQNDWLYHYNKHISPDSSITYQAPILTLNTLNNRPRPPQKLLFSATLSQDPEKLQQLALFQPKLFTSVIKNNKSNNEDQNDVNDRRRDFVGKYTTPTELTELYVTCSKLNRPLVLYHLIKTHNWRHILCFVNSIEGSRRLAVLLKLISNNQLKISEISAGLRQNKRESIIKRFSTGQLDMIVSTDSLARGIDIPGVQYVVCYEPPKFIKNYIHRIGRTGRAGKVGTAITFVQETELPNFKNLLEAAGKIGAEELSFVEDELDLYTESYQSALKCLRKNVIKKHSNKIKKVKYNKTWKLKKE